MYQVALHKLHIKYFQSIAATIFSGFENKVVTQEVVLRNLDMVSQNYLSISTQTAYTVLLNLIQVSEDCWYRTFTG